MKIKTYNQKGEISDQASLPKEIFEVPINPDLVYQVIVSQISRRRQGSAKTKDRSEARGGGRKPWRQKGTGRARHGSIRSPIWKGGGVTFGPNQEKEFKKKINKKMKTKALFMVLSSKLKENSIIVLDNLKVQEPKTKEINNILNNLKIKGKSIIIANPSKSKKDPVYLGSRNIPKVSVIPVSDINALDIISAKFLVTSKDGIKIIKETFLKK